MITVQLALLINATFSVILNTAGEFSNFISNVINIERATMPREYGNSRYNLMIPRISVEDSERRPSDIL